jgi:hypothetical protein
MNRCKSGTRLNHWYQQHRQLFIDDNGIVDIDKQITAIVNKVANMYANFCKHSNPNGILRGRGETD